MMRSPDNRAFSPQDGHSQAYGQVIDLLASLHPNSWQLDERIIHPNGKGGIVTRVTTITGYSSIERAILRKVRQGWSKDSGFSFEGGWYGASGIEPVSALTQDEAQRLFSRVKTHAEDYLKREIELGITGDVVNIIKATDASNWDVSNRWDSLQGSQLIGYMAMLAKPLKDDKIEYKFSINAVNDLDHSKVHVKLGLEKRGFSSHCFLLNQEEQTALDVISDILNLPKFHREDLSMPCRK